MHRKIAGSLGLCLGIMLMNLGGTELYAAPTSQPTTPPNQATNQATNQAISGTFQATNRVSKESGEGAVGQGKKIGLTILFTSDLYGKLRDFRCHRKGVKGARYKATTKDFASDLDPPKKTVL